MENHIKLDDISKYKHIHMVAIGGISMSGVAEILKNWGFYVTGSDANRSEITDKLLKNGISVVIGHDMENAEKADLIVYSAAVKQEDPELVLAREKNIPVVERCDFVGYLTRKFKNTIGVSGTHGKTTTTSMLSLCFIEAGLDPTIQVGALLEQIGGNYRVGNSDYFILEACEYVESFLKFSPKTEIILNIDNDHLDYFKNFENIKKAFVKYTKLLPDNGLIILNGDDKNCLDLSQYTNSKSITYGIKNENADYTAKNISFDEDGFTNFDVYHNHEFFMKIVLSVPGLHNVLNSLSCVALCTEYHIPREKIQTALKKYTGAHRRFEYVGSYNQISVYDDYGHHPTEIKATANALQHKTYHESWVVFQPHTYSRLKNLLPDFAEALLGFDHIIITDVYAAREKNTYGISSKDLVSKIKEQKEDVVYISDFNEIVNYLKKNAKENDIILTLGAGTVTDIGPMILAK